MAATNNPFIKVATTATARAVQPMPPPEAKKSITYDRRDPDCTLVIKNLPENINEQNLKALFAPYASLTNSKLIKITLPKKRGLAFVDYNSTRPVLKAIKHHHQKPISLMGRVLDVQQKTVEKRGRPSRAAKDPKHNTTARFLPTDNQISSGSSTMNLFDFVENKFEGVIELDMTRTEQFEASLCGMLPPQRFGSSDKLPGMVPFEESFSSSDNSNAEGLGVHHSTFNVMASILESLEGISVLQEEKQGEVLREEKEEEEGYHQVDDLSIVVPEDVIANENGCARNLPWWGIYEFKAINMELPSLVTVSSSESDNVSVLYEDPEWDEEYMYSLPQSTIGVLECLFDGEVHFDESDSEDSENED